MKKTAASGAKTPLFDRIFKPEVITLENGHTVTRPRSRTPLIALLVIAALAISVKVTGFNLAIIVKRANQLTKILSQIFQPDPSFFSKVVTPLLDTIKMSIMGSVIGCLLALPYAVAASANINRNKVSLSVLRFILNIVRTLPTLRMKRRTDRRWSSRASARWCSVWARLPVRSPSSFSPSAW